MALNLKLSALLWFSRFEKPLDVKTMSVQEIRELNVERLRKMRPLVDYEAQKMYKITNRFVDNAGYKVPVRIYQAEEGEKLPIVMFFHGGGFVISSLETYDNLCRRLAAQSRCIVVSVDYRLAPEHKFPAAPEDCYAATVWAKAHAKEFNGDAQKIAVCGDSAGGNLATVVAMMARDRKELKIAKQILIYPTVDSTFSFPSIDKLAEGYLLTKEIMKWFLDNYRDKDTDIRDPYFAPYFAQNLNDLPPALIITAEYDPLRDEGAAYAQKLKEAGVPVVYQDFKGMIHLFYQMPKLLAKARKAERLVASSLRTTFGIDGLVVQK